MSDAGSVYKVTGEPGAFDQAERKAWALYGVLLDERPLVRTAEVAQLAGAPGCTFRRLGVCPDDFVELRRSAADRADLSESEFINLPTAAAFQPQHPAPHPLFAVDVWVSTELRAGVLRLEGCSGRHKPGDGSCRYLWPVFRVGQVDHSSQDCANSSSPSGPRLSDPQCLDGTLYETCGSPTCEGYCDDVGTCSCRCHD